MRKRVNTSIEGTLVKEIDRIVLDSDLLKDRSDFFEFILRLLPYMPKSIDPTVDIKEFIKSMAERAGVSVNEKLADEAEGQETDEQRIKKENLRNGMKDLKKSFLRTKS